MRLPITITAADMHTTDQRNLEKRKGRKGTAEKATSGNFRISNSSVSFFLGEQRKESCANASQDSAVKTGNKNRPFLLRRNSRTLEAFADHKNFHS